MVFKWIPTGVVVRVVYAERDGFGNPTRKEVTGEMTGVDELLERVRSRRKLPTAPERRRIREAAHVSLRDVATALGVSHTAVASWENGATPREHRAAYAQLLEDLKRVAA